MHVHQDARYEVRERQHRHHYDLLHREALAHDAVAHADDEQEGARERAPEHLEAHGDHDCRRKGAAVRRAARIHEHVCHEPAEGLDSGHPHDGGDEIVDLDHPLMLEDEHHNVERTEQGEDNRAAGLEGDVTKVDTGQVAVRVFECQLALERDGRVRNGHLDCAVRARLVAHFENDALNTGIVHLVDHVGVAFIYGFIALIRKSD
mmetsp:Transcript_15921/g.37105  ORF Transcript_15921/g.37105 Transcript_15921/m.37105 type:complete len:205 (+) Transcript_15921:871-1485(+)